MVKTFLIANLAVVSVWIGPTTPCRALPSGFSSTPASLLVLAPHHRNHHHYRHHWRWSRSPPLWYGAPAIGTHMMPLPGYGAPETGSSQAPTPPAATVPELPQGGPLSGKQETASQRPVDPVGGPASQIGALTPFPGCHTAVPRPAAGQLIPMNRRRWVRAFDREASELELANGRHNAGSPAARSVAEAA